MSFPGVTRDDVGTGWSPPVSPHKACGFGGSTMVPAGMPTRPRRRNALKHFAMVPYALSNPCSRPGPRHPRRRSGVDMGHGKAWPRRRLARFERNLATRHFLLISQTGEEHD